LTIGAGALDFTANQIRLHTPPPARG
jgi:hypothetical protein